ncbi:hypothetical protein Bhyg_02343 [Pseudolycoriella hygida]|uniref:Uncharacterized protein n=1 Tax=Pseudolycoriella hygida TaxID=35572 RepID=A0A9Q0S7N9_9DIPT|nr:hypothetical protein Bhyg_02343 [Pseudolycoriella hygida]
MADLVVADRHVFWVINYAMWQIRLKRFGQHAISQFRSYLAFSKEQKEWLSIGVWNYWLLCSATFVYWRVPISVSEAEAEFIRQCQQQKSAAFYGLTDEMKITEEKFCYSLRNNMADIHILGEDNKVRLEIIKRQEKLNEPDQMMNNLKISLIEKSATKLQKNVLLKEEQVIKK